MYVCMYVSFLHIILRTCIHSSIHTYIHVYIHTQPILQVGQIIKGKVKSVQSFGVFVRLNHSDMTGLCHISEVLNVHVYVCMYMYMCIYNRGNMCVRVYVCVFVCMYVCMYVCLTGLSHVSEVCMYVCMYACTFD
jgi:hypothetical protein